MGLYETLFDYLKLNNVDVKAPNTIEGDVKEPCVVIKLAEEKRMLTFSSKQQYVDFLCYVPLYTDIEAYTKQVEQILKGKYPYIKDAYQKTKPYFDESYNAWMTSMLYYNVRKMED